MIKELMNLDPVGNLQITGGVSQRLPAVTNGLISHFQCDGKGGLVDIVGGLFLVMGKRSYWRYKLVTRLVRSRFLEH